MTALVTEPDEHEQFDPRWIVSRSKRMSVSSFQDILREDGFLLYWEVAVCGGGEGWCRAVLCACARNLALSENRRKGALCCTGGRGGAASSFCFLMPTLNIARKLYRQILSDSQDNLWCQPSQPELGRIWFNLLIENLSSVEKLFRGREMRVEIFGSYFMKINSPSITWHGSRGCNCIF